MIKSTEYHPFTKFLHWSIVAIIALQFITSFLFPEGRRNATPDFFLNSHMSLGLLIIPFALLMFFMRYFRPVEKSAAETPGIMGIASVVMEYLLYALLLVIPLAGWVAASSRGIMINFFGLINVPEIVARGSTLGRTIGEFHSLLAWAMGFLLVGHIGAAFYHHFILKDNVLNRMRPHF